MSFWLEILSILLQIYTFACNFCSRKGGRASIGTYTVFTIPGLLQMRNGFFNQQESCFDVYIQQLKQVKTSKLSHLCHF